MEMFIESLTKGILVKGVPVTKDNFWDQTSVILRLLDKAGHLFSSETTFENQEEWLFNAFNKLSLITFKALMQHNKQTEQQKEALLTECKRLQSQCTLLTGEVKNLRHKLAKTTSQHSQEESKLKIKYQDLEEKIKKCAWIINSTLGEGSVMGQVRDIITQSIPDCSPEIKTKTKTLSNSVDDAKLIHFHKTKKHRSDSSAEHPVLTVDDDETSILAPSSPDYFNDSDGIDPSDNVKVIPETVPFNCTPRRQVNGCNLLKNRRPGFSPLKMPKSPIRASSKRLTSPLKKKNTPKNSGFICENSQDFTTYSPPIVTDFGLPSGLRNMALSPTKLKEETNLKAPENNAKIEKIMLRDQQPFQSTPPSTKKLRLLKQTKLSLSQTGTRVATKATRASPCKQETKRRKRGKDPEEWTCKDCYRIFREAEACKKIDVRKMPVSMNFCTEHRNRYTYYLNTPPGFWDCGIGRSPRNGHLHPLDASAIEDDDFIN